MSKELYAQRVNGTLELIRLLEKQQRYGFLDIIIGHELWFLRHHLSCQMCYLSSGEILMRVRPTIAMDKTILTVSLGVRGAVFINSFQRGIRFNGVCFRDQMFTPFASILSQS
jgi:hypothetical protein